MQYAVLDVHQRPKLQAQSQSASKNNEGEKKDK